MNKIIYLVLIFFCFLAGEQNRKYKLPLKFILPDTSATNTFSDLNDLVIDATKYAGNLLRLQSEHKGKTFKILDFKNVPISWYDNSWLNGFDSVEVRNLVGNCTYEGGWYEHRMPFYISDVFRLNPSRLGKVDNSNEGFLINTVSAGSSTLNIIGTHSFNVGDRIFIADYERQMAGWPPNFRQFEFNEIVSISGAKVILKKPTQFTYSNQRKDWSNFVSERPDLKYGKARIYKINHVARYAKFINCNIKRNPNSGAEPSAFIFPSIELIVENSVIEVQASATCQQFCIYKNSTLWECEPDKNVTNLIFDNTIVNSGIHGATGVLNMVIKNGSQIKRASIINPKKLLVENSILTAGYKNEYPTAAIQTYPWNYHTDLASFKNVTFNKPVGFSGKLVELSWGWGNITPVKVVGNDLYMPDNNRVRDQAPLAWYRAIGFGSTITANDKTVAKVLDIIFDGSNHIIKTQPLSGKIKAGQTWRYVQTDKVIDGGGNKTADGARVVIN